MRREDYLGTDDLPEMPIKFTYDELKSMTANLHQMLGREGFGSVFSGTLQYNTKVAVKQLENIGQGMKEFLSEVTAVGRIHHVNLVRLVRF